MVEKESLGPIEIQDGKVYGVETGMCMLGGT